MIENLKKYFKNCDKSKLTMKFSEIENILGVPLVKEAYKYESFWYKKGTDGLPSAWQSQGFEVTNVDFCSREVHFHKAIKESSKLMIPKIFLTDKIPKEIWNLIIYSVNTAFADLSRILYLKHKNFAPPVTKGAK